MNNLYPETDARYHTSHIRVMMQEIITHCIPILAKSVIQKPKPYLKPLLKS
jgi:hypothetical protein